ncbi:MAG TPA: hypothetical protein VGJ54_13565, partial [Streptosporangiaceae bacterium]
MRILTGSRRGCPVSKGALADQALPQRVFEPVGDGRGQAVPAQVDVPIGVGAGQGGQVADGAALVQRLGVWVPKTMSPHATC